MRHFHHHIRSNSLISPPQKNNSPSTSNLPSWIPKKPMNRSIFRSKIVPRARLLTIHLNRRFVHLFVPGLGRVDWQTSNSFFFRCLDGFTPCGNMKVNMNFKRFYGHNFNDSKWFLMSKPWSNSEFTCFFTFWACLLIWNWSVGTRRSHPKWLVPTRRWRQWSKHLVGLDNKLDRLVKTERIEWKKWKSFTYSESTFQLYHTRKTCTCQSNGIFSQHLYMSNTLFKNQ